MDFPRAQEFLSQEKVEKLRSQAAIVVEANKKKAVKTKNGMAPEELSNVKMDIIR